MIRTHCNGIGSGDAYCLAHSRRPRTLSACFLTVLGTSSQQTLSKAVLLWTAVLPLYFNVP